MRNTASDDILVQIFSKGISLNATDIHLTPKENSWHVTYRVLGSLTEPDLYHANQMNSIIVRLKIKCDLDIAQTRQPQSGQLVFDHNHFSFFCRVSTHPTLHGEKIAIRLLHLKGERKSLDTLGYNATDIFRLKKLYNQQGIFIFSGPTGSGKTTSLYALLDELHHHDLNIMTLEDPIESTLDYACQTQIGRQLNYAEGIKSLLRQDPDVILVGEIRDEETARMAFRAAMTGHLVLTTLHANSNTAIVERLKDFSISQNTIDSFLLGTMIQDLVPYKSADGSKLKLQAQSYFKDLT